MKRHRRDGQAPTDAGEQEAITTAPVRSILSPRETEPSDGGAPQILTLIWEPRTGDQKFRSFGIGNPCIRDA